MLPQPMLPLSQPPHAQETNEQLQITLVLPQSPNANALHDPCTTCSRKEWNQHIHGNTPKLLGASINIGLFRNKSVTVTSFT
eukprot:2843942-Amphidinium_carterae.1